MVFGFGKRPNRSENSFRDPIVQSLSEMIGVYEDQASRPLHLSQPNETFPIDIWPPPGAEERHDRTVTTSVALRNTAKPD